MSRVGLICGYGQLSFCPCICNVLMCFLFKVVLGLMCQSVPVWVQSIFLQLFRSNSSECNFWLHIFLEAFVCPPHYVCLNTVDQTPCVWAELFLHCHDFNADGLDFMIYYLIQPSKGQMDLRLRMWNHSSCLRCLLYWVHDSHP